MKYRFILTYQATDSETTYTRTCFPLHGDDLSISIDRAEGEWYYTRNLDGKLVFERDDYDWIMGQEFDGTFTLNIKESHDNGATFYDYFTGTFSRASLEIDEDNHKATLNGLKEGVEDLIKNGKNEDYDLMKLIPDSYAKEVQGQVPPALAMVDYRSTSINKSDIFCGGATTGNGYKVDKNDWTEFNNVETNQSWYLGGIYAEAMVAMKDHSSEVEGIYKGVLSWHDYSEGGYNLKSIKGDLYNDNNCKLDFYIVHGVYNHISVVMELHNSNGQSPSGYSDTRSVGDNTTGYYNPSSYEFISNSPSFRYEKVTIYFHYIRATLLTQSGGNADNVLDTGDYYKRMAAFEGSGLQVEITANTSEQPNGHRMVPGTDEYGGTPQYFAPPDMEHDWIPLAEDNWNYASMWYTIQPSVANGLDDPSKFGSFRWTRCWTIGTCIQFLLQRITNDKVVFSESTDYSQFLYGNPNPVEDHEPFQWLVTQKSNVMHPAATGASRCIVRLDWFLKLLRNAFNCYYWFERRNDGRYDFRIEHVEYFRRGGAYNSQFADQLDLTVLKPTRNFLRNGIAAKHYADQTNRYTFDLDGMVEKYTYSWQGDGGSDDFLGNPMYFRAGWIEKGTSDDHQVDNIFTDLDWLMLNAGTATASSKNYDGLFLFGGYHPFNTSLWRENQPPLSQYFDNISYDNISIWVTIEEGYTVTYERYNTQTGNTTVMATYTGTGKPQLIQMTFTQSQINVVPRINFSDRYNRHIIHRVHRDTQTNNNIFRTPNVRNMLRLGMYIQNGVLAWPWLQCEYLHYDIPAAQWTYKKDEYTDNTDLTWETDGTIKLIKKQTVGIVPIPDTGTELSILGIMGVKTGLGIGLIESANINLSSRDATLDIIYSIAPQ